MKCLTGSAAVLSALYDPLGLWVMTSTCSLSALLLQISGTKCPHWLQIAQVSWVGFCRPANDQQVYHRMPW